MKSQFLSTRPLIATSLLAAALASAQDASKQYSVRFQADEDVVPRNRFGLSYRVGFNIDAKFSNLGGFSFADTGHNPGPATGGVNHEYDDGFNRVDSTHNGEGLTWNWGFNSASQVSGDNLNLHSSSGLGDGSSKAGGGDPQHGVELSYARYFGTVKGVRWGIEAAVNYIAVDIDDSQPATRPVTSTAATTTDTYPLGGIDPFVPLGSLNPYQGTFFGPGPLISDGPIRRTQALVANGVFVSGSRRFNADIYGLRLGPYLEVPLSARWALTFSGGLALVDVNGEFKYNESDSTASVGPVVRSGSGTHSEVLAGGYVNGNVSFALSSVVSAFAGVEYQNVGDFSQTVNGRRVELNLGESIFIKGGLNYSF